MNRRSLILALAAMLGVAPISSATKPARTVVFLGDSLTAGLGLPSDEAFPALVGENLARRGFDLRMVNAGVSGDTTAGGLRRIGWVLRQKPDVMVIELGANDALRGLEPEMSEANLRAMVEQALTAGAQVLLVGMKVPPNYGSDYVRRFEEIFPRIAAEFEVPLMPFLLEGVAGIESLNRADGIHPNAEGHRLIAQSLLPYLEEILRVP